MRSRTLRYSRQRWNALEVGDASRVVHLGTDAVNDFEGAKRMGMEAW